MSVSGYRSPPLSPTSARAHGRFSPDNTIGQSRMSTNKLRLPASHPYNLSGNISHVPTSPTSSTESGGSPQQFYSPALPTLSDAANILIGNPFESYKDNCADESKGDDLGDRTLTLPQTRMTSPYKGKERANGSRMDNLYSPSEPYMHYSDRSPVPEDLAESMDDSKRIEENLQRWAEKEKLRRAKTRSRYSTSVPSSQASSLVSDGMGAVSGLARRLSGMQRHASSSKAVAYRKNSKHLSGIDLLSENRNETELQTHSPPRRGPPNGSGLTTTFSTFSPPLSATSASFSESDDAEARASSRFIEDLDEVEMRSLNTGTRPGHNPTQSYADLRSKSSSSTITLTSPTKSVASGTSIPAVRKQHRSRADGNRAQSFTSLSSFQTFESYGKDTVSEASIPNRLDTAQSYFGNDIGSSIKQYYSEPDETTMRLVHTPRASQDYAADIDPDKENVLYEHSKNGGWLGWILCCGCVADTLRLDEDEQAGKTFPE